MPDGSATAKAIDYSLNRWAALTRYLDDGDLPIDNNWVENQIRPIAIGRNNWLFAGSLRAGKRAAAVMSLVHSARLNGHDPYAYLQGRARAAADAAGQPHRRVAAASPLHVAAHLDELSRLHAERPDSVEAALAEDAELTRAAVASLKAAELSADAAPTANASRSNRDQPMSPVTAAHKLCDRLEAILQHATRADSGVDGEQLEALRKRLIDLAGRWSQGVGQSDPPGDARRITAQSQREERRVLRRIWK